MARIFKKTILFSLGTVFSRILGFVRELVFSYYFGASYFSDLFFAAFRIPNFLRKLLAEGTLSFAYINVYSEIEREKGQQKSRELSSAFFYWILIVSTALTLFVFFYNKETVDLLLRGFSEEKSIQAAYILRWVFPYIIFISLASIFAGYLNIKESFFIPAVSSAFLNIALILFIFFLFTEDHMRMGRVLGVAVLTAGALQFSFLMYYAIRYGFRFYPRLLDPGLKKMILFFIPGTFAMAITQINVLVDSYFASYLPDGGYSHLWYGNRIVQLPLAVFGIALSTVMTPYFASNPGESDIRKGLSKAYRINSVLLLPCILGIIIFSEQIISMIFHRGNFNAEDVLKVGSVLFYYGIGLWFFAAIKITMPVFYSMKRYSVPVLSSGFALIINTVMNYILIRYMGGSGLALATSLSAFLNFLLLYLFLGKRIISADIMFILRLMILGVLLGGLFILLKDFHLLINIIVGITIYPVMLRILDFEECRDIIELFRRKINS